VPALPVVFTRRAARQVQAAADWWRVNRKAAPSAFRDDVAAAVALIAEQPASGAPSQSARHRSVRRVHLPLIGYHLYYRLRFLKIEGGREEAVFLGRCDEEPGSGVGQGLLGRVEVPLQQLFGQVGLRSLIGGGGVLKQRGKGGLIRIGGEESLDAALALLASQLDEELDVAAERGVGGVGGSGEDAGVPAVVDDIHLRVQAAELAIRGLVRVVRGVSFSFGRIGEDAGSLEPLQGPPAQAGQALGARHENVASGVELVHLGRDPLGDGAGGESRQLLDEVGEGVVGGEGAPRGGWPWG